jgi:opacity protein-like surface antigen
MTLREDPPNPITADELAKAKLETSTPIFTYKDFYIGPQIGASILMDITGTLRVPNGSVDGELEANTGVRLDIPMGYTLSDFFAFEFSPGVIYNSFSTANAGGVSLGLDGYVLQIPLLLNLVWSLNTDAIRFGKSRLRPYFGGGIGAVFSLINTEGLAGFSSFDGQSLSLQANTWTLGYQALIGLDYDFDQETSFGVRYEFTGTSNQSFSDRGKSVSTGGLLSQNILVRFNHRF